MLDKQQWAQDAWRRTAGKIKAMSETIGVGFPHASLAGKYDRTAASAWTSGFWPGLLWLAYREEGDESLKRLAQTCEAAQDEALDEFAKLHHDVGFMWCLSAVASYKLTGDEQSKQRALKAASILAGRFNPQGNFIRAWNSYVWRNEKHNEGWAIIDCMMNISLLFWATEETGDARYRHIAVRHADTVLGQFIRPDGSVHHIVCFNAETGERESALGGQGYSPDSAWARGVSWAIYGMAICYRYTGQERYLRASQQTAHYFMANLPEDGIPYWDFRLPDYTDAPRDASAAAIAASGMLLLARLLPADQGGMYERCALRLLQAIDTQCAAYGAEDEAIVRHATGNFPTGKNIDTPLIYGDYFYAEALTGLLGSRQLFW
ncbi:glycoside hydrolase family 88 protein [Paenibacillus sp. PAMC21692]|uniref:glycoside hydrolase family 88 protein n=1 Tax=Paenibacillus sp. PAMC21692 TaxID=2762320 RepID=UPI00164D175F|nr:glycoside hydrolase family 88 protein [Paenibacillus sp. PAMC21692]QNK58216.1 glycoside hydrolase family 88 protein [Paenibacillus sp. PAMC21692]